MQLAGVAGEGGNAPGGGEMGGVDIGVEVRPDVGRGEDIPRCDGEWHGFQDSWGAEGDICVAAAIRR